MEGDIGRCRCVARLNLSRHRREVLLTEGRVGHAQTLFDLDDFLVGDHGVDKAYEVFLANLLSQLHPLLLLELVVEEVD